MRHWIAAMVLATAGLTTIGPAFAGQADICYSAATPSNVVDKLTSSTPLDCPGAGHHTLAQLAQSGWSVASIQPVTTDYSVDAATQSPHSTSAWMVVIEKESAK